MNMEPRTTFVRFKTGENLTRSIVIPSNPICGPNIVNAVFTLPLLSNPGVQVQCQPTNSQHVGTAGFSWHQPQQKNEWISSSVISSDVSSNDWTLPRISEVTSLAPSPSKRMQLKCTKSATSMTRPILENNTIKPSYIVIKKPSSEKFYKIDAKKLKLNKTDLPKLQAYLIDDKDKGPLLNIRRVGSGSHNKEMNILPLNITNSQELIINPANLRELRKKGSQRKVLPQRKEVLRSPFCHPANKPQICPVKITTHIEELNPDIGRFQSLMRSNRSIKEKEINDAVQPFTNKHTNLTSANISDICQSANKQRNVTYAYRRMLDFTSNESEVLTTLNYVVQECHNEAQNLNTVRNPSDIRSNVHEKELEISNDAISPSVDKSQVKQNVQRLNLNAENLCLDNSMPNENKKGIDVFIQRDKIANKYISVNDHVNKNVEISTERPEHQHNSSLPTVNNETQDTDLMDCECITKKSQFGELGNENLNFLAEEGEDVKTNISLLKPEKNIKTLNLINTGIQSFGKQNENGKMTEMLEQNHENNNIDPNKNNPDVCVGEFEKCAAENIGAGEHRVEKMICSNSVVQTSNTYSKMDNTFPLVSSRQIMTGSNCEPGSEDTAVSSCKSNSQNMEYFDENTEKQDLASVIEDSTGRSETDEVTVHNVPTVRNEISEADSDVIVISDVDNDPDDNNDGDVNNDSNDILRKNRNTEITDDIIVIDSDDDIDYVDDSGHLNKNSNKIHDDVKNSKITEVLKGIQQTISVKNLRERMMETRNQRDPKIEIHDSTTSFSDIKQEVTETSEDIHFEEDEKHNILPLKELVGPVKCEKQANSSTHEQFFIKDLVKTIKIEPPDLYDNMKADILIQQLPKTELSSDEQNTKSNIMEEDSLHRINVDGYRSPELVIDESADAVETDPYIFTDDDSCDGSGSKEKSDVDADSFKNNMNKLKCRTCHETFKTKALLKKHKLNHTDGQIKCKTCNMSFKSHLDCMKHISIHRGGKTFWCGICSRNFNGKNALVMHHDKMHRKEPYVCDCCFEKFKSRSSLMAHYIVHTGERPYYCDGCGDLFHKHRDLVEHRLETKELPFVCEKCDKKFQWKSLLRVHQKVHRNENAYVCDGCSQSFKYSILLFMHQFTVTDGLPCKYQNILEEKLFASKAAEKRLKDLIEGGEGSPDQMDGQTESNNSQRMQVEQSPVLVQREISPVSQKEDISSLNEEEEEEAVMRKQRKEIELLFPKEFQHPSEPHLYFCPLCFKINYNVEHHMKSRHKTGRCRFCSFTSHSLFSHVVHMNKIHKLICSRCGMTTLSTESLCNHLLSDHFKGTLTSDKICIIRYNAESSEISTVLFDIKIPSKVNCQ